MGYYMDQEDTSFRILKENKVLALAAVQNLYYAKDMMSGGSSKGEKWFSWVDMEKLKNANCLRDALRAWRWDVDEDESGDISNINFHGEKLGDDAVLFLALAPFVQAGSFIQMQGEDGVVWQWRFDGKTLKEVTAKLVFEDEE